MKIRFYGVGCGDAARIEYIGTDQQIHFIWIDSGYPKSFRDVLRSDVVAMQKIDLCVITHSDNDHIGGIQTYIQAIQKGKLPNIVQTWWFNPLQRSPVSNIQGVLMTSVSDAISVQQATDLACFLQAQRQLSETDILATHIQNFYGLTFHVLSPTSNKLKKWRDESLENSSSKATSFPVSAPVRDYQPLLKNIDISKFKEDVAAPNGSSIAFLITYQKSKLLWLADAHPTIIVASLKNLGYSAINRLKCDWVKVAHHGSNANNNNELYNMIDCNNYLFSVDGTNKHGLPHKSCFARILHNNLTGAKYRFVFTHDDNILRGIFSEQDRKDYNFETIFSNKPYYDIDLSNTIP